MDELVKSLKVTLATVVGFYIKAHGFHWNVEGTDFYQYHKMFEDIYSDVYDSVDVLAEHIRALSAYAPASFKRFEELSKVEDELQIPSGLLMVERLLADNEIVIGCLNETFALATKANKQGLVNYLSSRIEAHNKWSWFLRSVAVE